jgi:REP element-mobilizing transposase RayT
MNIAIITFMTKRSMQLDLALRSVPRWGGSRAGAGRKPTGTAGLRHGSRERFPRPLPTHVTLRMHSGVPSLRTVPIVHEIERTFVRGCVRPGFRLVHYSLQGNHAHLIVEATDRDALGRGMKAIGTRIARAVNRIAKRHGCVLADRYHSRLLRTPREVHRALRYVLFNARRHAAKAGAAAPRTFNFRLDPASSARWFDGWKPGSKIVTERASIPRLDTPAVARARTWLLAKGWRLHGLLDPADVPG